MPVLLHATLLPCFELRQSLVWGLGSAPFVPSKGKRKALSMPTPGATISHGTKKPQLIQSKQRFAILGFGLLLVHNFAACLWRFHHEHTHNSGMKNVLLGLMVLLLAACTNLLPSAVDTASPFQSFNEARAAIESLTPMQSKTEDLVRLGLDPLQHPNTRILTYADVLRRFLPSNLIERKDLDPGVLACLQAREACRGWEIHASKVARKRTGSFFMDFTNFKRRTETTGWRFNGLVLLIDEQVVYRAWGGQPKITELQITTNPLGPLQDIGPSVVTDR